MGWLIDENLPRYLLDWLRERGDDVLDVADSPHRSEPDRALWQTAGREGRVVVTRDLGFLLPALRPAPPGIAMVRVPPDWRALQIANLAGSFWARSTGSHCRDG